jgi:hypothetical protein
MRFYDLGAGRGNRIVGACERASSMAYLSRWSDWLASLDRGYLFAAALLLAAMLVGLWSHMTGKDRE